MKEVFTKGKVPYVKFIGIHIKYKLKLTTTLLKRLIMYGNIYDLKF